MTKLRMVKIPNTFKVDQQNSRSRSFKNVSCSKWSFPGSGKTSLLDVIACRSSGRVTGNIYYNNTKCTRDVIQNHATYVMQADRLLPNLTVRETLTYTAKLKLPGSSTARDIERKVNKECNFVALDCFFNTFFLSKFIKWTCLILNLERSIDSYRDSRI